MAVRQRARRTVVVCRLTLLLLVSAAVASSGSERCSDFAPSSISAFKDRGRMLRNRWVVKKDRSRCRVALALWASCPASSAKAVTVHRRASRLWFRRSATLSSRSSAGVEAVSSSSSSSPSPSSSLCLIRSFRASSRSPKKSWLIRCAYLAKPCYQVSMGIELF